MKFDLGSIPGRIGKGLQSIFGSANKRALAQYQPTVEKVNALEEWARAPENAVRLERAGIEFAFTTRGLRSPDDFPEAMRKVMERGLAPDVVLASVTTRPAGLLGLADRLESLIASGVVRVDGVLAG